jgi:hypothetical protein
MKESIVLSKPTEKKGNQGNLIGWSAIFYTNE